MSNLQTHYHFKLYFQNMDQHTGSKWLIHGTKHHKDNVVVVVNFISDRQYKNKDKLVTKQNTSLLLTVRGHQRSPWAHRAGGLKGHMFIRQPRAEQVRLEIIRHNGR